MDVGKQTRSKNENRITKVAVTIKNLFSTLILCFISLTVVNAEESKEALDLDIESEADFLPGLTLVTDQNQKIDLIILIARIVKP